MAVESGPRACDAVTAGGWPVEVSWYVPVNCELWNVNVNEWMNEWSMDVELCIYVDVDVDVFEDALIIGSA